MSEQNTASGFISKMKFLENKEVVRLVVLIVGLGGVSFYFSKKNSELKDQIEQLNIRIDEQDEKIDTVLKGIGSNIIGLGRRKQSNNSNNQFNRNNSHPSNQQREQYQRFTPSHPSHQSPPPQQQQQQQQHSQQSPSINPLSFLTMFMQPGMSSESGVKIGTATEVENEDERVDEAINAEIQELKEAENENKTDTETGTKTIELD